MTCNNIHQVVKIVCENEQKITIMNEDHVVIVDISGSTSTIYDGDRNSKFSGKTILQREMEIAEEIVLKNQGLTRIFAFAETVTSPIELIVNRDEELVQMPTYTSGSITNTHLAFRQVNNMRKPKSITVITDGESSSRAFELKKEIDYLVASKIKLTVIAVSAKDTNMNIVSSFEEKTIPGMDLINILGNAINTLLIYNQFHKNAPFVGAFSSEMNKSKLTFMDQFLSTSIPEFINKLISVIESNKHTIDWGSNFIDYKKMVSQIGKLLTALFPFFPEKHTFIGIICSRLNDISNIPGMTIERIKGLLSYGFEATKNCQPIILTNVEQHVKEASVKTQQFADAVSELKQNGTTGGKPDTIGFSKDTRIIVLNNGALRITDSMGIYPQSQVNGITYFTTDSGFSQGTRIAMREFCGKIIGFPNSTGSPNVIFFVASRMFLMFLSGLSMDSIYMKEMRKIAIIQTSMDIMVAKGKYSGKPLYQMWKEGMLPKIHFSKNDVHSSLYIDPLINHLGMSELIWWATMMCMLGIFDSQKATYAQALESASIPSSEEDFLLHLQNTFSCRVIGGVQCVTLNQKPASVFTLEEFGEDDMVYQLSDHGSGNRHCTTKTLYSETERDWVMQHGCVWCNHVPSRNDFDIHNITDPNEQVNKALANSRPLTICSGVNSSNESLLTNNSMTKFTEEFKNVEIRDLQNTRYVRINLLGITGSGKSTYSALLKVMIERNHPNAHVLIVSSDKWKMQGLEDAPNVRRELIDLENAVSSYTGGDKLKVVIVDLCNDRGIKNNLFGYNMAHYESYTVCPNMNPLEKDLFPEYEYWCLRNVLERNAPGSGANYMLNPITAGLKTCIEVHNMKTRGVKGQIQNNKPRDDINANLSMTDIHSKIDGGASRYAQYLASKSMDTDIVTFLSGIKL